MSTLVTNYALTATAFDVAIGPVNGVTFKGRQLVTTAAEMVKVAERSARRCLIPIHDGHQPFEGLVDITSSSADLESLDLGGIEVVTLASGQRFAAV